MSLIDETHDPARRSWVRSANDHPDFPIQNLPFAVFAPPGAAARGGVAIGDQILDLGGVIAAGLIEGEALVGARAAALAPLNQFFGLGAGPRRALRRALSGLLAAGSPAEAALRPHLYPAAACRLDLPARIGDYTDFYVGIHHATAVGRLFRPDQPLMPNYKHVPIGYHGRASSVRPSGVAVRRPNGQRKPPELTAPVFGPSRRLDYELELGIWIGPGNELGEPIPIGSAADHVAGFCLLNDWSARDIQAWEYQPLGPFLAKNFGTTISPWVVTPEALAPFRRPAMAREEGDPGVLPYLDDATDRESGGLSLDLGVWITTERMRRRQQPAHRIARSDTAYLYWTVAQMVAHHASGGCDLHPGDLFGSGTISGPDQGSRGSLLEATEGGRCAVQLPDGEERRFLEDGDEVTLTAHAHREGYVSIGFGLCQATVLPAL